MTTSPFRLVIDQTGFKLRASTLEYMGRRLAKLDTRTRRFPVRSCHVAQEHSPHDGGHAFVISLQLPQATLVGRSVGAHLRATFDQAFKKVLRQLDQLKPRRRDRANGVGVPHDVPSVRVPDVAAFPAELVAHLDELRALVDSAVESRRRVDPDFRPCHADLVETALLEALEDPPTGPAPRDWRTLLSARVEAVVDRRFHSRPLPTADLRPEEPPSGPPRRSGDTWRYLETLEAGAATADVPTNGGDEPASDAGDPAASLERRESLARLVVGVESLPPTTRLALRLHHLEGLGVPELSRWLEMEEEGLREELERAEWVLRSGVGFELTRAST